MRRRKRISCINGPRRTIQRLLLLLLWIESAAVRRVGRRQSIIAMIVKVGRGRTRHGGRIETAPRATASVKLHVRVRCRRWCGMVRLWRLVVGVVAGNAHGSIGHGGRMIRCCCTYSACGIKRFRHYWRVRSRRSSNSSRTGFAASHRSARDGGGWRRRRWSSR